MTVGLVTSPVASILLRVVQNTLEDAEEISLIAKLGFRSDNVTTPAVSRGQLLSQTNEALREMLRQRGLPASGSKAALVNRLLDSP